ILLLALQPEQASKSTPKQIQIPQQPNSQQEQETYNDILNKINKEVDKLTNEEELVYHPGSKTINYVKVYDAKTKKIIQRTFYNSDGKTIKTIEEYTPEGKLTKITNYIKDGKTIFSINEYNSEENIIKQTFYNPDGTVKEESTY
ncbi:flagellar protein FlaG, partial [Paulownia witches'-broom phytoplasma]|uniref:flagellar protein FlaG n=1 Tax=Paulownia witches'-broom phytoplasma TaxID=39647 RepID=UPI0030DC1340